MNTRFIYLLETIRKQSKEKNRNNKIVLTDGLELQSRIHEFVRPNNLVTSFQSIITMDGGEISTKCNKF